MAHSSPENPRASSANGRSHQLRTVTASCPVSSGYHNTFPNTSAAPTLLIPTSPPAYGCHDDTTTTTATTTTNSNNGHHDDDDAGNKALPPARFKILPREEEGNEQLPQYTCSLHKEAVLERKMELHNPFERAQNRRWHKCYAVLHGTKLDIYKPKKQFFVLRPRRADPSSPSATPPVGWLPGSLLESYTLQLAQVGTATDYKKRNFVIRLRAQTEQFLLSCRTLESFLEWIEALSAAVDLAPPLEERSLPRYHTLPRRRRRRAAAPRHAPTPATEAIGPESVQEQLEIIRQNFPHLLAADNDDESAAASAAGGDGDGDGDGGGAADPATTDGAEAILEGEDDLLGQDPLPPPSSQAESEIHPAFRITQRITHQPEEAFDRDGKWAPRSALTREDNMRLARRCAAELFADAPRQSDWVVVKGKRFRLVYESKKMVPDVWGEYYAAAVLLQSGAVTVKAAAKANARVKVASAQAQAANNAKLARPPEYEEAVAAARPESGR